MATEDQQPKAPADGYRDRIYGRYVSAFKGHTSPDELRRVYERHARYFDHLFAPVVSRGGAVDAVEVACGPGHFLFWAVSRGLRSVRGFDISEEQVAAARAMGLPAEVSGHREYLTAVRGEADLVVGMDILEHLTRDEGLELLDLCRAALRPGGVLFLTTPNGAGLRSGPVRYGDLTHETVYTPQTLALALRLAGFDAPQVWEIRPPPTSVRSRVRGALWRLVRLWPMLVDVVETGSAGSCVYTRNMAVRARRAADGDGT